MIHNLYIDLCTYLDGGCIDKNVKETPLEALFLEGEEAIDAEGAQIMVKVGKRNFNEL